MKVATDEVESFQNPSIEGSDKGLLIGLSEDCCRQKLEANFGSMKAISSRSSKDLLKLAVFSVLLQQKGNLYSYLCWLQHRFT